MSATTWNIRWENNNTQMICTVHSEPPGEFEDDLIELEIIPAEENGRPHGWYLNLEDALALIMLLSRAAFHLQVDHQSYDRIGNIACDDSTP